MLKVAVLVSGGGTNLQAILDAVDSGKITNTEIRVVISNNEGAYALERAKNYGTEALLLSPKSFETREEFNQKLLEALKERDIDLVVLAGYLVVVPPCVIKEYENRIINIHPSLIPSFCGKGCYGLHVHEKALARGVKVSGATVHFVDEGTDTGPIIMQNPRTGRYTGSITAPHYGTGRMEHPTRNNQSDCEWKGTCRRQSCYN